MPSDNDSPTDTTDEPRTIPEPDDRGKDVVDSEGQEIGVVTDVEGDTVYVDPHQSPTESVASKLGWSDEDETLPVSPEFVVRIDDEVVLDVERDEQFQEEAG